MRILAKKNNGTLWKREEEEEDEDDDEGDALAEEWCRCKGKDMIMV